MKKIVVFFVLILILIFVVPFGSAQKRKATPTYELSGIMFPEDFFWGASTSSHQIEGNNANSLTQWEKDNAGRLASEAEAKLKNIVPDWDAIAVEATDPDNYVSGIADDAYNRYSEDIKLMRQTGLNSYRFSIEWSRIEPNENEFNPKELEHYRQEILALKKADIQPFVTLWHRTSPVWVAGQGDWENPKTIADYGEYVKYVVENLGSEVEYWMTFNEPILHELSAYIQGTLPPQVKSLSRGQKVLANMVEAHNRAYKTIHAADAESQVGSTQAMQIGYGAPATIANRLLAGYLDGYANWKFLDETKAHTDFIGIQYYGPTLYSLGLGGKTIVKLNNFPNTKAALRSDTGVEIYPYGIYELITETHKRYGKPIIITENGIADAKDQHRAKYVADHLYWVKRAIDEGIPVKGYFYWSLLDNYEWDSGFWPRFGLIQIDYSNDLQRTIRPSAQTFKTIINN